MDDVEEQILSYPHLPPEEQRDIEAYVEKHPEWAPLLQDVRALEGTSQEITTGHPSDALLATYVVARHLATEEMSSLFQQAFSQLEDRIDQDEALRQKVNTIRQRLRKVESEIEPAAHFERVTGHKIEGGRDAQSAPSSSEASRHRKSRSLFRSVLQVFVGLPLMVRRAAVTLLLLVGVYGGLYAASVANQSTLERLSAVEVSDQVVDNYYDTNTRSLTPGEASRADELYLEALSSVRSARTSTLGLFPQYDAEELERAEQLFHQVLDEVESGSFLALEARFYLGKIALAQEDVEEARSHFKTVVKQEGRKATEAYEILRTLQEEYPMQNP